MKTITQAGMEAIVKGLDLDARKAAQEDDDDLLDINRLTLVNLRFEEVFFNKKVASEFADFMRHKHILESIGFIGCKFEDTADFRKIMENIRTNKKIIKVIFQDMTFDEEIYGKSIASTIVENLLIRELDLSYCVFEHPKCLYDISMAILNERCRLNILKIRGLNIKQFEAKILQLILMRNKQLTTLDISHCKAVEDEAFSIFLQKFNEMCNIRYLTMEDLKPDPSTVVQDLGETLAKNTRLEVLIMKENKLKWTAY